MLFKRLDEDFLPQMYPMGGQRWMVDIEDLSRNSLGTACEAGYVILLTTQVDLEQEETPILLALKKTDGSLIHQLSEIPGVRYVSIFSDGDIYYPRFRVKKDRAVQREFGRLCEAYSDSVLFRVKAVERTPDPDLKPRLIPIPKSVAVLELFGNLQNLSFDGLDAFQSPLGTPTQILVELSSIIAGMKCYRLVVGNLTQTADLVCELVEG
jgi:hypothetical protein